MASALEGDLAASERSIYLTLTVQMTVPWWQILNLESAISHFIWWSSYHSESLAKCNDSNEWDQRGPQ